MGGTEPEDDGRATGEDGATGEERPTAERHVLTAIAVGGVLGALGRHGVQTALPHRPGGVPWATFAVNVSGCLLIGALMVVVTEVVPHRRLVRPFLGVGVLGGYTTFSTYAVDVQRAVAAGAPVTAVAYLAGTVVVALLAVAAGAALATAAVNGRRGAHPPPHEGRP